MTPFHRARLARAERLFEEVGVREVLYLFVPDYHGAAPADRSAPFVEWCRRPRSFTVRWALHGLYHREARGDAGEGGVGAWMARRFLTGGEGEFLSLRGAALRERLSRGRALHTAVVGAAPDAFVAPAWLFNDELLPALGDAGIRFTEDHRRVYHLVRGTACDCPVVTWATRTRLRRWASPIVCGALLDRWAERPAIRIALHPFDFDYRPIEASIRRSLERVLRARACAGYEELFAVA